MTDKPRAAVYKHFHRIAWLACALALVVIVFGAFVRLSNAGLSCPDWPTCYGQATWPGAGDEVDHAATAIRAFDDTRAWREQVHRMLAGTLGVLVLLLAVLAAKRGLETAKRGRKAFYYLGGLTEGTETIAAFAAFCLFPGAFPTLAWIFGALCGVTALGRVWMAYRDFGR